MRENIMKKLKLAILVALGLMLAFTPLVPAYAQVQLPADVKFKGYVLGRCHLVYYEFPPIPGHGPVWYGVASGSMVLDGYAQGSSYEEINNDVLMIYGMAYFTDPGDIQVVGFIAVRWFENRELHQLWIVIYSKPTSQGIFQPETDKFVAGIPPTVLGDYPPGFEELLLSYKAIYKIGSNFQYLSGPITVLAGRAENPPWTGIEIVEVGLFFGDYAMMIIWFSETVSISWGPGMDLTVPPATILVRDVKLL
jgi:hypothetical protein